MAKRLTKIALLEIKGNADLFAKICKMLDLRPTSMSKMIERNGHNLNRYDVVEVIAKHMGIPPSEAVEEYAESVSA